MANITDGALYFISENVSLNVASLTLLIVARQQRDFKNKIPIRCGEVEKQSCTCANDIPENIKEHDIHTSLRNKFSRREAQIDK